MTEVDHDLDGNNCQAASFFWEILPQACQDRAELSARVLVDDNRLGDTALKFLDTNSHQGEASLIA